MLKGLGMLPTRLCIAQFTSICSLLAASLCNMLSSRVEDQELITRAKCKAAVV
jgi:hypothetical protein